MSFAITTIQDIRVERPIRHNMILHQRTQTPSGNGKGEGGCVGRVEEDYANVRLVTLLKERDLAVDGPESSSAEPIPDPKHASPHPSPTSPVVRPYQIH
jgi:hypothetical protein